MEVEEPCCSHLAEDVHHDEEVNCSTDEQTDTPVAVRRQTTNVDPTVPHVPCWKHSRRKISTFLTLLVILAASIHLTESASTRKRYTNTWAVKIHDGQWDTAKALADKYGYVLVDKIMKNYFLFSHPTTKTKSMRRARRSLVSSFARDTQVDWLSQQVAKKRVHRDNGAERWNRQRDRDRARDGLDDDHTLFQSLDPRVEPNDEWWEEQWYLHKSPSGLDHNVKDAWEQGYTGRNVVVTILDDGLERTHPDIQPNYDPAASYDVNDNDDDPMPRYDDRLENRHGTRCAGEVAAVINNRRCVVGIAYNAKIGGIRMLDGEVTDAVEAKSLSHNSEHIDIYSSSWGPEDDGRTLDGPAPLAQQAFEDGIRNGRQGKGSIFVWASGNGGRSNDSCNCDGYTNSIYTLSISAATENRHVPYYSEACSSTMATTYSSGATGRERMIATTDLRHGCTKQHTGTSASAPLAAAICALVLEANGNLTWRDLQHIVIATARPNGLLATDWRVNGVGRNVSHSFGYGLMDAGGMVRLAKTWRNVPEQHTCSVRVSRARRSINTADTITVPIEVDGCQHLPHARVSFLEHVQARISLIAPKRGDVQIFLTSPAGTRSQLLARRERDLDRNGFRDWSFMTTHMWGETAAGVWYLQIENSGWRAAELLFFELVLHGTAEPIGPNGALNELEIRETLERYGLPEVSTGTSSTATFSVMLLSILTFTSCSLRR